jgi:hypothetical protein
MSLLKYYLRWWADWPRDLKSRVPLVHVTRGFFSLMDVYSYFSVFCRINLEIDRSSIEGVHYCRMLDKLNINLVKKWVTKYNSLLYWGHEKKSHNWIPSISPWSYQYSPSSLLPDIPLQQFIHINTNIDSDIHVATICYGKVLWAP